MLRRLTVQSRAYRQREFHLSSRLTYGEEYEERNRENQALLEPIKKESAERLARMRACLRQKQDEMNKGG